VNCTDNQRQRRILLLAYKIEYYKQVISCSLATTFGKGVKPGLLHYGIKILLVHDAVWSDKKAVNFSE
jgi:hypothetical protein